MVPNTSKSSISIVFLLFLALLFSSAARSKPLAMTARQSEEEIERAFSQAAHERQQIQAAKSHITSAALPTTLPTSLAATSSSSASLALAHGAAAEASPLLLPPILEPRACKILVGELETAAADFSQYMRTHCSDVSPDDVENENDTVHAQQKMPEHCRQSLTEAQDLFDTYDAILVQHCRPQYEALILKRTSTTNTSDDGHHGHL